MKHWTEIEELNNYYQYLSGKIPALEKELERLINVEDEIGVLVSSRRCLEVIVTDICEKESIKLGKTIPLKGIIDKLNKEEKAPSHIISSMLNLNNISTYGAHPKEFDPRQVRTVLINLITITEWYLDFRNIGSIGSLKEKYETRKPDVLKKPSSSFKPKKKAIVTISTVLLISIVIIFAFDVFHILNKSKFEDIRDADGRISIAVMPFQNLSGDTLFNIWQGGFQNLLITTLSNSKELSVRQYQTMYNILDSKRNLTYASITPSIASELAIQLETRTFILGNILKAGKKIRVNAQLVDAETEEIYKTYEVNGNTEDDIFAMADSLSGLIKNYLEIKKLVEQHGLPFYRESFNTNSSEAFQYYIHAYNALMDNDFQASIEWGSKAIKVDSGFISPYITMSFSYFLTGYDKSAKKWCKLAYKKRDEITLKEKLMVDHLNAYYFETPKEQIKYLKQFLEMEEMNTLYWYLLGLAYYQHHQYKDAANSFEKALDIHKKWGTNYRNPWNYFLLGKCYHRLNEHKKEKEVYELGLSVFPDHPTIISHQGTCALSQGDTNNADKLIAKYKSIRKNKSLWPESNIILGVGNIYSEANLIDNAEICYREAFRLDPGNPGKMNSLAWLLINNDMNVNEGLELVEKALELNPDNWYYLDTKGWGLYKQGKYKEALKVLKDAWKIRPSYRTEGYQRIQEVEQALINNK